jgi:hypothetical protein
LNPLRSFFRVGFSRGAALALAFAAAWGHAQDSSSLASKSIEHVFAVQSRVFALSDDGTAFSRLNLFTTPAQVTTGKWPWNGGAEDGAAWSNSLLLYANYWPPGDDSTRVARVTSLRFAGDFRGGDSLVFRDRVDTAGASALADGARLTAVAVRDTGGGQPARVVLGFGRLGIATLRLARESSPSLFVDPDFADTVLNFIAFPTGSNTALPLHSCRWNRLCRVDTVSNAPPLDSVIALAIDSSHADSLWLLVATQKGLRRGLWGSLSFPYVMLPNIDTSGTGTRIRSAFTAPARSMAWVFTESRFFYSDDHGASWRVPPPIAGISVLPSSLSSSSPDRPPHAAFYGDSTFINFNFDTTGLVLFRHDTLLANTGTGLGQILLNAEDGLDITAEEGSLTTQAVARNGNQAVLVTGTTIKGVFYRRLDVAATGFTNINRLRTLKNELGEVITYPTLLTVMKTCGERNDKDTPVRIGYRLKKDARVTITVYNYAMEKVRVVVKNAPRRGGVARSESLAEDRWDGCDDSGRFVSVGTYYILVESSEGEKAFGKALVTRGRK